MKKILVTGATGFLGKQIVKELLNIGEPLKLFVRNKNKLDSAFKDLNVYVGDLRDKGNVEEAMDDCDRVIHVAGFVSLYPKDTKTLYEINYNASVNLFEVALKKKIKKFIYTNTSSCLGAYSSPNMKLKIDTNKLGVPYIDSKNLALQEALNHYQLGLPIVIICPTFILGEGDHYLTSSELIYSFLKKKIPGYLNGGLNPVYVGDVALAHIKALEYGKNGECYVAAGNENISLKDLFTTLEKISGVKAPKLKIPYWLAYFLAFFSELFLREPDLNRNGIKMGSLYWYFDSLKMENELKVKPTKLITTLERSVYWITNEFIKKD
ncbi:MAG: NAD-dependent epimerase/dehydratase family protein [Spirochaetota bacterium]|nr:NAD-dependent epimerase/dehydratase family protein [Spirochaetota bacterium]